LVINFKQENNVIVYCISKTSVDDAIFTVKIPFGKKYVPFLAAFNDCFLNFFKYAFRPFLEKERS